MKISEIIKKLQIIKDEKGDLEFKSWVGMAMRSPGTVTTVELNDGDVCVVI